MYQGIANTHFRWSEKTSSGHLKQFSRAVDLSPSIVLITNRQGIIEFANPAFLKTSGFEINHVEGKGLWLLTSDMASRKEYKDMIRAFSEGRGWEGELINRKRNGKPYILSVIASPCQDEYGDISNYVIVGQDITQFRETEHLLEKATQEKTELLSELHHRVKNNLAVISGLMELQVFNEKENEVKEKLYSGIHRIQSMAAMHELLYESGNLYKIEFSTFIEKIVSRIKGTYPETTSEVEFRFDLETLNMTIDQAHPFSLIINEVLTNVVKHAFTKAQNDASKKVTIQLYHYKNQVYLFVTDNGRGLSAQDNLSSGKETLGMKLVDTLAKQLNAEYRYENNSSGGASFFIKFERKAIQKGFKEHTC